MSEILHIEPDATAEAVRRRLARLDGAQVAVVLPNGWGELNSIPRLRLIQRQAVARNQQIALVTHDLDTRQAAQQLGIPVYGSETGLAGRTWRMTPVLPTVDPRSPLGLGFGSSRFFAVSSMFPCAPCQLNSSFPE